LDTSLSGYAKLTEVKYNKQRKHYSDEFKEEALKFGIAQAPRKLAV
jgi:hypothetical protein